LDIELADTEIKSRISALPEFKPKITRGYLARYARMVTSANTGAIVK
jgi:dihydroxy-acid dehydratase